ncbi:TetR/AcrR family transcriptional regulator [Nonomuraea sp. NPDC050478]|uniref:TetR/AcrR family transcriptional regulator n=1 Tax=Nonomuraea sp. NPDC050478 TaxID=3364365 RepID=UPI0037989FDF
MGSAHDDVPELRGVPKAVLLAWNLAPATTKGPKPRWTLAQLLDAAVRLGDRSGIDAISMSGLAKELGSGTMSLYRYVESREDLVVLAADHALGTPPRPDGATWRERLRAWVLDLRRVYQDHPWLTAVPVATEPLLPSYVRRLETGLECLGDLHLSGPRAITVLTLLWTYTRGDVEQSAHFAAAADGHSTQFLAARLRVFGGDSAFTRVLAVLEADQPTGEDEFLDAVEIILNGIESTDAHG